MKRKQTRRSISVSAAVYDRISEHCKLNKIPMSKFVEERAREFFDGRAKAKEFRIGSRVNYHARVGGPITLPNTIITGGPYNRGDHVSWRIEGKPGTIDEVALSPVV